MPLSAPRDTRTLGGATRRDPPVAANVVIFQGALVVMAAGVARPGRVATGDVCVGVAKDDANNTGGAAGAIRVPVERGVFHFKNSAAGDAIALADIGADCWIVDDETVAKTNGTNTRSKAGRVWDVDAAGVWVEIV